MRIRNYTELFSILPEEERTIVDVLRQIIIETLPSNCKEKISYNVRFNYFVIPKVSYVSETARFVRYHLAYKLYKWLKDKGRQAHRTLRQRSYDNLVKYKSLLDVDKYVRLRSQLVKVKG